MGVVIKKMAGQFLMETFHMSYKEIMSQNQTGPTVLDAAVYYSTIKNVFFQNDEYLVISFLQTVMWGHERGLPFFIFHFMDFWKYNELINAADHI